MAVQQESRVKKTLLNARVNLIFYALSLFVSFFTRKIFLDKLGVDFVGLTTTLQNLLGFLNLAELGIGSAIGYVLYKPIFDKDESKLNEIISVFGYIYRWIGFVIIGGGVVLSAFLPLIFKDITVDLSVVYYVYYSFLLSSLLGYFVNYKQTLLGADQKNYVVAGYLQTTVILKTILQAALAYYTQNYYIWATNEIIFGVIFSIILNWKIAKTYPWLKSEIALGKGLLKKYPEIFTYTRQLFVHKISEVVQTQSTPLLLYSFVSLKVVALYGNYTIITSKITMLLASFLSNSTVAGVGNLIAEGNSDKIIGVFKELMALRIYIAGCVFFGLYNLINSFIFVWLGSEFVMSDNIVLIMCISFYIALLRTLLNQFINGYGLFSDIGASILESIISIGLSILLGSMWGIKGVLLGGVLASIIVTFIWKVYFLYKRGFKISVTDYYISLFKHLLIFVAAMSLVNYIISFITFIEPSHSFISWGVYSMLTMTIFCSLYLVLMFVLFQETRVLTKRFWVGSKS